MHITKIWIVEERDGSQWHVRAVRYSRADAKRYLLSLEGHASRARIMSFTRDKNSEEELA